MAEEGLQDISTVFGGGSQEGAEGTEQSQAASGEEAATATQGTEAQTEGETGGEGQAVADEAQSTEEADKFFENFNTRFNTEFGSDDDIKSILEGHSQLKEQSDKWTDYETRVKDYDEKIAELERNYDPLTHFSSKESYIAEQLRKAHPDKDPALLQDVVMSDLKDMGDMDVLAKELLLDNPNLEGGLAGAKAVLDEKYGIDRDDEDYEMSMTTKNRIMIDANKARKDLGVLKESIELPTVMTAEEKEQAIAEAKEAKAQSLLPYADKFKQFDKWSADLGDGKKFEFDVPDSFKEGLDEMFKGFFLEADMDINEENLESVIQLRNAMFLTENFPKIYEVIRNEANTTNQESTDALLNNEAPENRSTRTDDDRQAADPSAGFMDWLNQG